ncbi:Protocadherin beta-16 [Varanus komodoensis]|nr:Protocadherin beta-16 [Varanus komodoensis]
MLHVLPVGGFSDPYLKSQEASPEELGRGDTLTTYLVVCLAVVSAIFLVCIISLVMVRVCRKGSGESPLAAPPQFPPARPEFPENGSDSQSGFLPRTYHYDVCLTGGSLSSEFRFLRPLIPVFSMGEPNLPGKHVVTPGAQAISEQTGNKESWEQVSKWHLIKLLLFVVFLLFANLLRHMPLFHLTLLLLLLCGAHFVPNFVSLSNTTCIHPCCLILLACPSPCLLPKSSLFLPVPASICVSLLSLPSQAPAPSSQPALAPEHDRLSGP